MALGKLGPSRGDDRWRAKGCQGEAAPAQGRILRSAQDESLDAKTTVFNVVPCGNKFEQEFAAFLRDAADVASFAKLPERFGFSIEYTDSVANLRYYEPDFAVVLKDGSHYLVETKGREDIDVAHKDRAAQIWCETLQS